MEAVDLVCFNCLHFDFIKGGCKAFPTGIPSEITSGRNKHLKPLNEQKNDIIFKPIEPIQPIEK
jgi:hypothetical protein